MNKILIWPLSLHYKIIFASTSSSLATLTCCDRLTVYLQNNEQLPVVLSELSGCDVMKLKENLQKLMLTSPKLQFLDFLCVRRGQNDDFSLEIRQQNDLLYFQKIDRETLTSWIAQLDLLKILMEENELEKQSQGKGCC